MQGSLPLWSHQYRRDAPFCAVSPAHSTDPLSELFSHSLWLPPLAAGISPSQSTGEDVPVFLGLLGDAGTPAGKTTRPQHSGHPV